MKVSIITATYNSEKSVGDAITSIVGQTYSDIQSVLIDGASKDKTVSIVKDLLSPSKINSKVISEPDDGIYDALNKGVRNADGEVIGLLHADDLYDNCDVISKVVALFKKNPNLQSIYGDLLYVQKEDTNKVIRYWKSGECTKSEMEKGWMPPHPTFFVRKEVYEKYGVFDTSYNIAADYDFMMRVLYKEEISTAYIPEVFVKMRVGGESNKSLKNIWRKSKEDLKAMKKNEIGGVGTLLSKNVRKIPQFFKSN
jgi:glycosyltransferase